MRKAGDIMTGGSGGRDAPKQAERKAKWDRVLDLVVTEKLTREDILKAYAALSVIQRAYAAGNEQAHSESMIEAQRLMVAVGKGLTKRWDTSKSQP